MRPLTVDISELVVSPDPDVVLIVYSLVSCVAVTAHDPVKKVGGMLHFMLPASQAAPARAQSSPGMFADTGVTELFDRMSAHGCSASSLVVKVVGGAQIHDDDGALSIGKRNYEMLLRLVEKHGLHVAVADVGGQSSRTVKFHVASGSVLVRVPGREYEL